MGKGGTNSPLHPTTLPLKRYAAAPFGEQPGAALPVMLRRNIDVRGILHMACSHSAASSPARQDDSLQLHSYADFIAAAKAQPEPQRLLWVLAKAELPNGYTNTQRDNFEQGAGGALNPVLCVDKLPEEVSDFAVLLAESSHTGIDWDIAFVTSLAGRGGFAPNTDEAEQPLKLMLNKIQSGIIADFLTFNKQGELVSLY